jgi:Kef-type K+ transport system membrane component KefB
VFKDPAGTLLLISVVAFTAPLLTVITPWLRLPALVVEILLGIIIGPEVLDLVDVTEPIAFISELGIASLIFLAGFELDPQRVKGQPMKLATVGWGISIVLGLAAAGLLHVTGVVVSELYVGLALTTTALGALLPIMRDAGILERPFGTHMLAIGSVGEFGPIVAVALVLSGNAPARSAIALVIFAVIAALAVVRANRPQHPKVQEALARTLRTSGQLYIRTAVMLIAIMTFVAGELELDVLLGAFTAGIVYRLLVMSGADHVQIEQIESKLEAVTLGYLVPIFFVVTGINFDLEALISSPTAMLKVPLFLVLLLVVRGVPTLLYKKELPDPNERKALALFSATGLPLIVVITHLGVQAGHMRTSTAAAMVGAGMLSIVLYPLLGKALLDRSAAGATASEAQPA